MTKLRSLVLLTAFVLAPGIASADGVLDWWEKWSGPKMMGVYTDLHLLCVTTEGRKIAGCERLLWSKDLRANQIRHIVDGRVGFYWKYGKKFSDVDDPGSVHALKIAGLYHYRVVPWLDLGAGAAFLRVTGDGFEPLPRFVVTPVSVFVAPFKSDWWKALTIRFEASFIAQGFTGEQLGNKTTRFNTYGGEWNDSFAIGYDLLRRR